MSIRLHLTMSMEIMSLQLRNDLLVALNNSYIKFNSLSPFQRILLSTDGTLTEILEAYLYETIKVIKLYEEIIVIDNTLCKKIIPLQSGSEAISRKTLLQGTHSLQKWLYAESIIITEHLEASFKNELLHTATPIGKLWIKFKVETFKEIVAVSQHPALELADYFDIRSDQQLYSRTYHVYSNQQIIMIITEKFPVQFFKENT